MYRPPRPIVDLAARRVAEGNMRKTRAGFIGLSILFSAVGMGARTRQSGLRIEVHIYNYSAYSTEMLDRAEQETARIFERIGIAGRRPDRSGRLMAAVHRYFTLPPAG